MYNLLTSYHAGSNREAFLMLPRPHILQPTEEFRMIYDGLRGSDPKTRASIPDPQADTTFEASRLDASRANRRHVRRPGRAGAPVSEPTGDLRVAGPRAG